MKKKSEVQTDYSSFKFLVSITGLGICLLALGVINVENSFLKFILSVFKEIGALLIISGGVGYFWDTKVKRSFMEEILEKVGIERDIKAAGIIGTGNDIFKIMEEKKLLTERTYCMDVLMHYVKDWPSMWLNKLKNIANKEDFEINIILPNPTDRKSIEIIAQREDLTNQEVEKMINRTVENFKRIVSENNKGRIRIYFSKSYINFSYYRFDNKSIVGFYKHNAESLSETTFMVLSEDGSINKYMKNEFDYLRNKGELIYKYR